MFSADFIFRQQENLVDNQKCQAGFRPLCNKILFLLGKVHREIPVFITGMGLQCTVTAMVECIITLFSNLNLS